MCSTGPDGCPLRISEQPATRRCPKCANVACAYKQFHAGANAFPCCSTSAQPGTGRYRCQAVELDRMKLPALAEIAPLPEALPNVSAMACEDELPTSVKR